MRCCTLQVKMVDKWSLINLNVSQRDSECCPRVSFEQDSQPQNSGQESHRFLSERRGDQSRQKGSCQIPRLECSFERGRDLVQVDVQIA